MPGTQYRCTKAELARKLEAAVGKTLGEVDSAHVFDVAKNNPKVTGIAGDVIEQSVIGYPPNSVQEPDLVVDGTEVELKTTGLRRSKKMKGLEAKEPMSITAVSLGTIAEESFYSSNFWHKVERMLLVYYLYDSETTVRAADYANFPILDYQFNEFTPEEVETLRHDWQIVHDFVKAIQESDADETPRGIYYAQLSSALRDRLMMIDTAPKYPHPPRFRLKRSAVTAIARRHFGEGLERLPKDYTSMRDIDAVLGEVTRRWRGKSVRELARTFGVKGGIAKGSVDLIVCKMFDAKSRHMADVELFARAGLHAKSVVLTRDGRRTEDMKLFTIDFDELCDPELRFEDSMFCHWFSEGSLICAVLQEPSGSAPLEANVFLGFRRIAFDDALINEEVKRTWEEMRTLIHTNALRDVVTLRNGKPVINKSGVVRSAPNFPKSHDHVVFVRGTSSDSTRKPVCVNGIRMYRQQLWIRGSYIAKALAASNPFPNP